MRGVSKSFRVQRSIRELLTHPSARDLRPALEEIDLEVAPGEFFGLLGHNGAGKSTLFKILATLVLPDAGEVRVAGHDVVEHPEEVRKALVPVIPNERSLYWRVSAAENLRLYADLYGIPASEREGRVASVLDIVGLSSAGGKQVGLFSSGMKQRLLIARAILGQPRVLLLDEPTRSLDPVSARDFRRFLAERIGRETGTTVLLATHDHEEVTELCDRVGVLHQGRLLAVGPTDEVLSDARERRYEVVTRPGSVEAVERSAEAHGGRVEGARVLRLELEQFPTAVDPGAFAEEPWVAVRSVLPVDDAGAAAFLARVVTAGAPVASFSRVDLSLADLLERVSASASKVPGA
jgi:ABC-2 type transport system ATP-binding protein